MATVVRPQPRVLGARELAVAFRPVACYDPVRISYMEVVVAVQMPDVARILIEQLAYVRACELSEIEATFSAQGDIELDSKEGQTVAIRAELVLDMDGLIRPEDQTRENLTTVSSLVALVQRRRSEHERGN